MYLKAVIFSVYLSKFVCGWFIINVLSVRYLF